MRCLMAWLYRIFFGLEIGRPTHLESLRTLEQERTALLQQRDRIEFAIWANRTQIDLLLSYPEIDSTGGA